MVKQRAPHASNFHACLSANFAYMTIFQTFRNGYFWTKNTNINITGEGVYGGL